MAEQGIDYVINYTQVNLSSVHEATTQVTGLSVAVEISQKKVTGLAAITEKIGKKISDSFSLDAVLKFAGESTEAYNKMHAADAQNIAALKSNGGAAGKTIEQLRTSAEAFSKTTLFDTADTEGAQALVQGFTNVRGAVFDKAIPAIQDMAQRLAGGGPADLKGASMLVGKALNDPIAGMKDLGNAGVNFSGTQKDMITSMVKHNDLAGAQGVILDQLNNQYGGAASAAREAAGGQGNFDDAVGGLKEGLGGLINQGLNPVMDALVPFVDILKSGVEWLSANNTIIEIVGGTLLAVGAAYLLYQGTIMALEAPMAIATAAQWALNAAMALNPVGIVVVALVALGAGFAIAYKHSETFRAGIDGIIEVGKLLGDVFMGLGKVILGALTFNPKMFMDGVKQTVDVTKKIADGGIQNAFKKGYGDSIAKSEKEKREEKAEDDKKKAADKGKSTGMTSLFPPTGAGNGVKPNKPLNTNGTPGADSTAVAGNKQVRNVQVTIGKLVENLTVATTNLQGAGSADIRHMITEILTGAVHDSELALSAD